MIGTLVRLGIEVVSEILHERKRARAAELAARQFAETPAPVRGCPRCHEVAYSPGQTHCYKCGALL